MRRNDSRRDDRSAPDVWRDQEVLAPRAVVAAAALTKPLLREITLPLAPLSCQRRDFNIDTMEWANQGRERSDIERALE